MKRARRPQTWSRAVRDRRRSNPKRTPQNWRTPWLLVLALALRHAGGKFHLDAAANASNAVASQWLGPGSPLGRDALKRRWWLRGVHGVRVFLNPPWKRAGVFVAKALLEVAEGRVDVVVMVLPSRIGAGWWRTLEHPPIGVVTYRDDIEGRIAFIDPLGRGRRSPAEGTTIWVARPTLRASNYSPKTAQKEGQKCVQSVKQSKPRRREAPSTSSTSSSAAPRTPERRKSA